MGIIPVPRKSANPRPPGSRKQSLLRDSDNPNDTSVPKRKKSVASAPRVREPAITFDPYFEFDNGNEFQASEEYLANFYSTYPSASMDIQQPYDLKSQMPAYHQVPMPPSEPPSERHRSTLMAMFMNDDDNMVPDILLPHILAPHDFEIDLILDDHGHTALHWAAALGRISLLTLLIGKGADPNRLNINGETALMRSVMVPNNFDRLSFPQLLDILNGQVNAVDKKNRTVLHHTAAAASLKGSAQSCRYYMECILDVISKSSKQPIQLDAGTCPQAFGTGYALNNGQSSSGQPSHVGQYSQSGQSFLHEQMNGAPVSSESSSAPITNATNPQMPYNANNQCMSLEGSNPQLPSQKMPLESEQARPSQLSCLVNMVDVCGDTPINIAARIGNRHLVDQLLSAGADASIPNKVGLRPTDFGFARNYISDYHHYQVFTSNFRMRSIPILLHKCK
jgi:ankyrin repeat protein